MSVILDSLMTLFTTRQKEVESLQNYTKQFQVTREVFESSIPIILIKSLIENKAYNEYATDMQEHEQYKNYKNKLPNN
jgi:hypothetical protein